MAAARCAQAAPVRGYGRLYIEQILGADEGCDFAFLRPPVLSPEK